MAFTAKNVHAREVAAPTPELAADLASAVGGGGGGRAFTAGWVALLQTMRTHPESQVSIDAVISCNVSVTTGLATIQVQFRPVI